MAHGFLSEGQPWPRTFAYKQERAQALAKTALALMGECDVVPTPDNFQLFYAYASGDNPAIAKVVGDMIAARKPFTPAILSKIRKRCLISARTQNAMTVSART